MAAPSAACSDLPQRYHGKHLEEHVRVLEEEDYWAEDMKSEGWEANVLPSIYMTWRERLDTRSGGELSAFEGSLRLICQRAWDYFFAVWGGLPCMGGYHAWCCHKLLPCWAIP